MLYEVITSLLARLCERADNLIVGDPADPKTDVGPMISEEAAQQAHKRIRDACKAGASLVRA